jgi:hypothetical protein
MRAQSAFPPEGQESSDKSRQVFPRLPGGDAQEIWLSEMMDAQYPRDFRLGRRRKSIRNCGWHDRGSPEIHEFPQPLSCALRVSHYSVSTAQVPPPQTATQAGSDAHCMWSDEFVEIVKSDY